MTFKTRTWTVSVGRLDLHASWQVELNQTALADVAKSFSKILEPFELNLLGL